MMTPSTKYIGYIGTYTKGESKGIYSFILDTAAGRITNVQSAAELDNPTYLTVSSDNRFLYSVVKEGENGGVAAFSVNAQTGELIELNRQLLSGASPCHLSVDSTNRFLFSANFHKAEVISYLLNQEDGSIHPPVSIIKHIGSGPDPRQENAHTHFAALTPDEQFVAVAELGSDQLITYKAGSDGSLQEAGRLAVRPGSGPRHFTFHPHKKFAYVMTEFSSEVIALHYHAENGSFSLFQTISTLPEDFKENNQGSAITISSDGQFLYAGNRGHNSIAVFRVNNETGELSFVERVSSGGDWPRDFSLDPTERFIVSSNQNTGNLVLYARDFATGKLTLIQSDSKVPDPVCVKFFHLN